MQKLPLYLPNAFKASPPTPPRHVPHCHPHFFHVPVQVSLSLLATSLFDIFLAKTNYQVTIPTSTDHLASIQLLSISWSLAASELQTILPCSTMLLHPLLSANSHCIFPNLFCQARESTKVFNRTFLPPVAGWDLLIPNWVKKKA